MRTVELDHIRLDAVREISSIATGKAATSLSAMLGKNVNLTVPNVLVEELENIPELLGGREKTASVVHFTISGQVSGTILLVFSASEILGLVNTLTGQKLSQIESLDEMGLSALKELGNIIIGAYMRVLAEELKLRASYSVPQFNYDMLGAILDQSLALMALETEHAVIMESEFLVREQVYRGHLIFIMTQKTVNTIIRALGILQN